MTIPEVTLGDYADKKLTMESSFRGWENIKYFQEVGEGVIMNVTGK